MKRRFTLLVLTLAGIGPLAAQVRRAEQQSRPAPFDIEIRALHSSSAGGPSRLCVGGRNTVRAEFAAAGAVPPAAIPVRLVLILPHGVPGGQLVGEGTVWFGPTGAASFTFVNVEVPERLRGRGAALTVRVNLDPGVREQTLANNIAALDLDAVTDWACRG